MTLTAAQIADAIPFKEGRTRAQFVRAVKAAMSRKGITYVNASLDEAGNCRICGEAGRCPGAHTVAELAEAEARPRGH